MEDLALGHSKTEEPACLPMLPAIKLARGAEVQAAGGPKPIILRTGLGPKDLSVQLEDVQETKTKSESWIVRSSAKQLELQVGRDW